MTALPDRMRQLTIEGEGKTARLRETPAALPQPGPGQLLIRTHAIGVNRADLLQKQGLYPPPPDASPILGLEAAGTVAALGPGVTGWAIGDRIAALTHGGAYADYVIAEAAHSFPLPESLSFETAAALPEALFTATEALLVRAGLHAGECCLLHGVSGGVGTLAVQIARSLGAGPIFATASNADKAAHAIRLGAIPLDYRQGPVSAALLAQHPRGADVILDMAGGATINDHFRLAAPEGRIITLALQDASRADVQMAHLLLKRLSWRGMTIRALPKPQKDAVAALIRRNLWPKIIEGEIFAVIDRHFPLKDADDAHAYMSTGSHVGKIILMP